MSEKQFGTSYPKNPNLNIPKKHVGKMILATVDELVEYYSSMQLHSQYLKLVEGDEVVQLKGQVTKF